MKICPRCNSQVDDNAAFCVNCGIQFSVANGTTYAPMYDPFDHTAEFDAKDISDNKVFAMVAYILGVFGIIIALLASGASKYTAFHVRQALKLCIVEILSGIVAVLLCWTVIVPIAFSIFAFVLAVIQVICFFQVCSGKAKEAAIIRSIGFLK
jgi:hypothetical protein